MSIHYKFKSANQYDTVTFDGLHISVKDLKKQIMQKKKFGKSSDFDLQITNAQTKETYTNENDLIPKNTSLIVARVPVAAPTKKQWDRDNQSGAKNSDVGDVGMLTKSVNIAAMDASEEEKIKTMMSQSTSEYDPSHYIKVKGGNQVGPVPIHYVCYKCHQRGHWIKDCKAIVDGQLGMPDAIKKSSGIPRSFMVPVDGPSVPGARLTPTGQFAVPAIDHEVYKEKKVEKPPFLAEKEKPAETASIPDDLLCVICKDLMQDAVMAPCCGNSFCDECIRNILVESEEAECPECNEKEVSPDELIPNRFIRNAVNNFKNKTGYIKKTENSNKGHTPPRPSLPDFVPPVAENGNNESETVEKKPLVAASASIAAEESSMTKLEEIEPKGKRADRSSSSEHDRERDRDRRSNSRSRTSNDNKGKRRERTTDADDSRSLSSFGSGESNDGSSKRRGSRREGYNIPSVVPTHANSGPAYYPQVNQPPFMRHDRSGTPTVDERYDPYGRPPMAPLMGPMPGPMYDPQYPPPMFHYGGNNDRGRPFRGRYHTPYGERPVGCNIPNDQEAAYLYFQNMLQKKDEWERERKKKHARSRSRSRPRSMSRPRSRSRSNPKMSPSGRRRSYTPKRSPSRTRRSRSGSRSPRGRSFVISRSRSRSYSPKSPIDRKLSPRKFPMASRSPPRYDRGRDFYCPEGTFDWDRRDRRGGYRPKNRPISPRHYPTYHRYRDEYDVPAAARNSPDRFNDRSYGGRYHETRSRRRSRSKSQGKPFFDDNGRYGEVRDVRSGSRSRREKSQEGRHRREVKNKEQSGRNYGKGTSRDREKEVKKRESSPEWKRAARNRSASKSRSRSRSKEPKRERHSNKLEEEPVERTVETPVHDEPLLHKSPSPEKEMNSQLIVDEPIANKHLWKPIAENRFESEPLERNPSPMVTEKSPKSLGKKEKKKDKEKKKRKKEKETDEEREARRKRKKEKKDVKKRKEVVITESVAVDDKNRAINSVPTDKVVHLPVLEQTAIKAKEIDKQEPVPESGDVLDLHPSTEDLVASEMLAPMPGLSRWEIDEPMATTTAALRKSSPETTLENAVTNEVLKRAENAIFKKAPSSSRPEPLVKKHSEKTDDRKSRHSSEKDKETKVSSSPDKDKKKDVVKKSSGKEETVGKTEEIGKRILPREDSSKKPKEEISRRVEVKEKLPPVKGKPEVRKPGNSIQITIPVAIEKDDQNVGLAEKNPQKISPHPRLSILERLGGKVDESSGALIDERSKLKDKMPSAMRKNSRETSDEIDEFSKMASKKDRSESSEPRKRHRSSSDSSDDSVKVPKKKHSKHKKEKKSKKKHRKELTDSSDSSDADDKKRRKKSKKNKKSSRH